MQLIIVYIILAVVIVYAVYRLVHDIRTRESSACEGCGGCDIKKELLKNRNGKLSNKTASSSSCCH